MRLQLTKILAKSAGWALGVVASLALLSNAVQAAEAPRQSYNLGQAGAFVVADVRLQGLQRVSAGTVFNIIPISVGDRVDNVTVRQITRSLFASGYFKDIQIARDGGVLIVSLSERPAIESIELDGNKAIESEALLGAIAHLRDCLVDCRPKLLRDSVSVLVTLQIYFDTAHERVLADKLVQHAEHRRSLGV